MVDKQHKENVGELWAARSDGKCVFVWVVERDWATLDAALNAIRPTKQGVPNVLCNCRENGPGRGILYGRARGHGAPFGRFLIQSSPPGWFHP